jgi:hypothetical protein
VLLDFVCGSPVQAYLPASSGRGGSIPLGAALVATVAGRRTALLGQGPPSVSAHFTNDAGSGPSDSPLIQPIYKRRKHWRGG